MGEQATTEDKGQGRAVVLPNGERRIDYIRDSYYNSKTGVHDDDQSTRSEIKNAINEMLEKADRGTEEIPYQIVFAATKTPEDPRIAALANKEAKAKVKAEKDAAEAAAKEEAEKKAAAEKAKDKK